MKPESVEKHKQKREEAFVEALKRDNAEPFFNPPPRCAHGITLKKHCEACYKKAEYKGLLPEQRRRREETEELYALMMHDYTSY